MFVICLRTSWPHHHPLALGWPALRHLYAAIRTWPRPLQEKLLHVAFTRNASSVRMPRYISLLENLCNLSAVFVCLQVESVESVVTPLLSLTRCWHSIQFSYKLVWHQPLRGNNAATHVATVILTRELAALHISLKHCTGSRVQWRHAMLQVARCKVVTRLGGGADAVKILCFCVI